MSTSKGGGAAGKRKGGAAGKENGAGGAGTGQRARAGSGASAVGPPVADAGVPPLTEGRAGTYVLLLVAGVLVAFAGTLVQAAWFPGGLLLALAGVVGLFYGGGRATGTPAGVLVPGAAWLVTVFLLLGDVRPEGDFLFGAGLGSYIFLLGGILVAVICATAAQMRVAGVRYGRVGG
ncbi:DUF6113 family protein [Streptomyces auratus]|uniref:Integral membrane protein n=1 Tax=Streptomyces auratus AGR0001 TaxID=1160718 RepID=J2K3L4_9ACTN|nr:DUF6113 family protein [Streptomyces auratus]QTZ93947.1 hypothetical protein SU9_022930 [Streptomyces auratus AGR0001]